MNLGVNNDLYIFKSFLYCNLQFNPTQVLMILNHTFSESAIWEAYAIFF